MIPIRTAGASLTWSIKQQELKICIGEGLQPVNFELSQAKQIYGAICKETGWIFRDFQGPIYGYGLETGICYIQYLNLNRSKFPFSSQV